MRFFTTILDSEKLRNNRLQNQMPYYLSNPILPGKALEKILLFNDFILRKIRLGKTLKWLSE